MVPVGIIAGLLNWNPSAVFFINFFAIIPLSAVMSFATEEISKTKGDTIGGLLNATCGNAPELIIGIVSLINGQVDLVTCSMVGSIISNNLLVTGMSFFFGGIFNMRDRATGRGIEQSFTQAAAQTTCTLLALSALMFNLPTMLRWALVDIEPAKRELALLQLSRVIAICLLIIYVAFILFQLRTHPNLFESETPQADKDEPAKLGPVAAGAILSITAILVTVCAEYIIKDIDNLGESARLNKPFVGLILLPIVGNAAEHGTAVVMAIKNKMGLAMDTATGSSIQIGLCVMPLLVLLAPVLSQPMTLDLNAPIAIVYGLSTLLITYTIQDGKSNYLEGLVLLLLYVIIAYLFYWIPSGALGPVRG
ncbi:Vacuolar calcium ion transporter 2 [Colletotrichum truncatum]|uniref:Vacuolar calcium ion transporter 2 n=1 Tax=Colletotrichum truncatum TaxID=5467 RepID=A0ACC3YC34_COLTU|nr:Vacuolar calcium ion transporter 2 [Colletotrichum truncatum]KAF6793922.1 Vacuolar calcium ion transporter 2 [Colletotrichum truncatum]